MRKEAPRFKGIVLVNWGDILDIIDGETTIGFKYDGIGCVVGMIPQMAALLLNIIFFAGWYNLGHILLISVVISIGLPIAIVKKDYETYFLRRFLAVTYPPLIALTWFTTGGITNPTGYIWMFAICYYNSSLITGKKSKFYVGYALLVNLIAMLITCIWPKTLIPVANPHNLMIQDFIAVFIVCFYIWATTWLQRKIAENVQDKLKESNEALKELNQKLDAQMNMQTQFTNSMNHELRSPLNGIMGNLEIMLTDSFLTDEDRKCAQNAYNSSKNMLKTVNDLLDFAKLRDGRFEIVPEDFDLKNMISHIDGTFRTLAEKKNLDFNIEIPDGTICGLNGDETRIEQIAGNLLSNAVKYTDNGFVRCAVCVETVTDKFEVSTTENSTSACSSGVCDRANSSTVMLHITVQDSGQGMSTDNIDEIAEPFVRFNSQKNKNIQGTGLGMNIVKSLVSEMNGEIRCITALGAGTTFDVLIPVTVTAENNIYHSGDILGSNASNNNVLSGFPDSVSNTLPVKKTLKKLSDGTADFSDLSILCIDDESLNLYVFKRYLEKTNATITTAENGTDGVRLASENKYDIIFIDHMMPGMDGIETHIAITQNESGLNKNTPFVMLSGNTGKEYRKVYEDEGFEGFLGKPVSREDLIALIAKIAL